MSPAAPDPAAPHVAFTVAGGVACVTLANPRRMNAMTRGMWVQLRTAFETLATHDDLRVIVIEGAGEHFCAGGAIDEYPSFRFDVERLRAFHEDEVWGALAAMLACDVPMIAAIEGNCMGAGIEIASCCDLRLASRESRYAAPIARLGFAMAPREIQLVGRELGLNTARAMLLEAATFDAESLCQRAFLTRLCTAGSAVADAQASAARITALAPAAARQHKRWLRALGNGEPLDSLLTDAYDYAASAEHREGITAFLEKRRPEF